MYGIILNADVKECIRTALSQAQCRGVNTAYEPLEHGSDYSATPPLCLPNTFLACFLCLHDKLVKTFHILFLHIRSEAVRRRRDVIMLS